MPECSQTPRRQRPDYLADFSSASSSNNTCSSSDEEEEEEPRKAEQGRGGGEKREKKVSYDLGDSKDKNLAERSGKAATFGRKTFPAIELCCCLCSTWIVLFVSLCLHCIPMRHWFLELFDFKKTNVKSSLSGVAKFMCILSAQWQQNTCLIFCVKSQKLHFIINNDNNMLCPPVICAFIDSWNLVQVKKCIYLKLCWFWQSNT